MGMRGCGALVRRLSGLVVLLGCLVGLADSPVVGRAVSRLRVGALPAGPVLGDLGGNWSEPEVRPMRFRAPCWLTGGRRVR